MADGNWFAVVQFSRIRPCCRMLQMQEPVANPTVVRIVVPLYKVELPYGKSELISAPYFCGLSVTFKDGALTVPSQAPCLKCMLLHYPEG